MIKIITGCMTSGKSERLIEEIDKCEGDYLILKPSQDTRDGAFVKTRAHDRTYPAVLVDETNEQLVELIMNGLYGYYTVFLDETQFFSKRFIEDLLHYCQIFNTNIVASGLTRDFKGNRFPSMTSLWSRVHYGNAVILFGKCYQCGCNDASVVVLMNHVDTILTEGETVQIEGETKNHYENLCDRCYEVLK